MKCLICGKEIKNYISLGLHIKTAHQITSKDYYDKFYGKHFCPICGKETSFQSIRTGYITHCSPTCAQLNPTTRDKYKQTSLELFGSDNIFSSEMGKQKIKDYNIQQYGVQYSLQRPEIRRKIKDTCIKQFGVDNPAKHNTVKQKMQQSCIAKFGVDSYSKTEQFKRQLTQYYISQQEQSIEGYTLLIHLLEQFGYGWYIKKLVPIIKLNRYSYVANTDIPIIEDYYSSIKVNRSMAEIRLFNIVKQYFDGEIICNTRKIIPPYELDLYIPSLSLAIEYNGSYYHSLEIGTPKEYHFRKSILCYNKGIRLIHFYEFEDWEYIESFLYHLFTNTEIPTNDFNKYSPTSFASFSGAEKLDYDKYTIYGSGTFTYHTAE